MSGIELGQAVAVESPYNAKLRDEILTGIMVNGSPRLHLIVTEAVLRRPVGGRGDGRPADVVVATDQRVRRNGAGRAGRRGRVPRHRHGIQDLVVRRLPSTDFVAVRLLELQDQR